MSDTEAQEAPAAVPVEKVKKPQKRGIGVIIREAVLAGKTNEEALVLAKAEFPDSHTTVSTVSWYRNQLRNEGHKEVPTARGLKKEAAALAEAAATAAALELPADLPTEMEADTLAEPDVLD